MFSNHVWAKLIDAMYVAVGIIVASVSIFMFFGTVGGYASSASCFEAAATISIALVCTLMLDHQWNLLHFGRGLVPKKK